ncbi:TetR family transcriptional regulator [Streptomyces sp. NPDC005534]|uniref:TetR family transcriptional regulator n=1 Tax=Streptomyces sp. NPDC005534 TaxID=3155714 RepID=UPI003454CC31
MTRQERAVRTREALIEAAARLFDRDGYEVTSLAAVTAKAQVSAGALYFHFATKADLADAVTHAALSRLRRIIDARTATRTDGHPHTHGPANGPGPADGPGQAPANGPGLGQAPPNRPGLGQAPANGPGLGHAQANGPTHAQANGLGHAQANGPGQAPANGPGLGHARANGPGHADGHGHGGEGGGGGAQAAGGAEGERVAGSGSPASVPASGGGGGPVGVGELQQLIDATHLFVRGLSRDVVLRAGFGLDGAWGERPVGEHAAEQGPVGRGGAGRRMGGEGPSGGWPRVGGGLRGVWSGWVHEVLSVAGARGVLASGVSARDVAVVVVAATVGFEVLGAQDPVWLAPDPLAGFWTLVLPALVPPPVRSVLQAGGSTAVH